MPEFKLTLNDIKTGKSYKKIISGSDADIFRATKIGSKINLNSIGFKEYEFEITGGSDNCGFPMRQDISGIGRKRPLVTRGTGVHIKRRGMKKRKTIIGNTLSHSVSQINLKVTKYGSKSIPDILGVETKEEKVEVKEKPVEKKPIEKPKEEKVEIKEPVKEGKPKDKKEL